MVKGKKEGGKGYLSAVLIWTAVSASLVIVAKESEAQKKRVVVDLTQQKNGCTDCHQGKTITPDDKEKDITLAGEVKNIPNHPKVDVKSTYKDCIACHKKVPGKTRFVNKLHDVHLNSEIYVGKFKQSCGGCHNMKYIKGM